MKHRILTDQSEIQGIIRKCQVCHVAMTDEEGNPYVVPMNFGFESGMVFLHSSRAGRKIDILWKNPAVCIEFSTDYLLRCQNEAVACSYSMKYRSVLLFGKVEFVEDPEEKVKILDAIMKNYSPNAFRYNPPSLREVCCWRVKAERMEGRVYGY